MIQLREHARLTLEAGEALGIGSEDLGLDRDFATKIVSRAR
jgi:hypothetical protein